MGKMLSLLLVFVLSLAGSVIPNHPPSPPLVVSRHRRVSARSRSRLRAMVKSTWPGRTLGQGLTLKPSTLPGAGWGLFATEPIAMGAVITTYDGEWVNRKDYHLHPVKTHFICVNNFEAIDGVKDPKLAQKNGVARVLEPPLPAHLDPPFGISEHHTAISRYRPGILHQPRNKEPMQREVCPERCGAPALWGVCRVHKTHQGGRGDLCLVWPRPLRGPRHGLSRRPEAATAERAARWYGWEQSLQLSPP